MASIPLSTMSSTRKSVRKHGLGVMEYQMGGMSASPLNLLFVIKGILQFSHDLTSLCINCLMLVVNLSDVK